MWMLGMRSSEGWVDEGNYAVIRVLCNHVAGMCNKATGCQQGSLQ
jgi:hypothetical protein